MENGKTKKKIIIRRIWTKEKQINCANRLQSFQTGQAIESMHCKLGSPCSSTVIWVNQPIELKSKVISIILYTINNLGVSSTEI